MYWQTLSMSSYRQLSRNVAGFSLPKVLEPLRRELCVMRRVHSAATIECRLRHSPACSRSRAAGADSELRGNGQIHFLDASTCMAVTVGPPIRLATIHQLGDQRSVQTSANSRCSISPTHDS